MRKLWISSYCFLWVFGAVSNKVDKSGIFPVVTSANLGLIFRPNPNGKLNFYYRFSPMVIHSVSGDLGYSFCSGYNYDRNESEIE